MGNYDIVLDELAHHIRPEEKGSAAAVVSCSYNPWCGVYGADIYLISKEKKFLWAAPICTGYMDDCMQAVKECAPAIAERFTGLLVELRNEVHIVTQKPLSEEELDQLINDFTVGVFAESEGLNPDESDLKF